jgi:enoyl-CoA hydratase/carnithine racemase
MTQDLIFTKKNHIGLISLNRTKTLNALTLDMIQSMHEQLLSWEQDPEVHAVVIKAEPGRAFCAGGDVRSLYCMKNQPNQCDFFLHEYSLNNYIHTYTKPYIALMDGITMGGGVGISLHGSHPYATENFIFAMPETGLGFFPDIGSSHLLTACPGNFGLYLALTGNKLNAQNSYAAGLIKGVIEASSLDKILQDLYELDLSENAFERVDNFFKRYVSPSTSRVLSTVHCPQPLDLVDKPQDVKDRAGNQFLEMLSLFKKQTSQEAKSILQTLEKKSPLSLLVTFQQFHKAKGLSLAECLKMDFCLVEHFMQGLDFYEGVRALLIDKDNTPHWEYVRIEDVPDSVVDAYFS